MGLNVLAQLESMAVLMEVAAMMSPVGFWSHVLNFYEAPDGSKQLLIYAKQTKVHKSPVKLFFLSTWFRWKVFETKPSAFLLLKQSSCSLSFFVLHFNAHPADEPPLVLDLDLGQRRGS